MHRSTLIPVVCLALLASTLSLAACGSPQTGGATTPGAGATAAQPAQTARPASLSHGEPPTRTQYQSASTAGASLMEICEVAWPLPGVHNVLVDRVSGSGDYTLLAELLQPTPVAGGVDLGAMLPGGELIWRVTAELDGDGVAETGVLAGLNARPDGFGYGALQVGVFRDVDLLWQSEPLPSERGERLHVDDINGDGRLELLSFQSMGAAGYTLYALEWNGSTYDWLRPQGGYFAGQDSFGEVAVRLQDLEGDGKVEILAGYGPAGGQSDVYAWNGQAYTYVRTTTD